MVSNSYKEIQSELRLLDHYNKFFKKVKSFLEKAKKRQLFLKIIITDYVNFLSIYRIFW